jgi:hypothetical protein
MLSNMEVLFRKASIKYAIEAADISKIGNSKETYLYSGSLFPENHYDNIYIAPLPFYSHCIAFYSHCAKTGGNFLIHTI